MLMLPRWYYRGIGAGQYCCKKNNSHQHLRSRGSRRLLLEASCCSSSAQQQQQQQQQKQKQYNYYNCDYKQYCTTAKAATNNNTTSSTSTNRNTGSMQCWIRNYHILTLGREYSGNSRTFATAWNAAGSTADNIFSTPRKRTITTSSSFSSFLNSGVNNKQQQQQQEETTITARNKSSNVPPSNVATIIQGPSLLTGTNVYRPSPSIFFLPGLRSLPFWTAPSTQNMNSNSNNNSNTNNNSRVQVAYNDPTLTSIVQHLESNYEVIREDYMSAVMGIGRRNIDIVPSLTNEEKQQQQQQQSNSSHRGDTKLSQSQRPALEPDYDVNQKGGEHASQKLHTGTWDWHSYVLNGMVQAKFEEACPKTASLLHDIKEHLFFDLESHPDRHNPFGFAFFSTLHGKSYIQPHTGPMNLRLRIHLPLIVPKDVRPDAYSVKPVIKCGIRVGDQIRSWEEGKVVVLDDSYEHEVWNETNDVRVLLLVDVWHPDVRKVERERIGRMFGYAKSQGWMGGRASDR